VVSGGTLFGVAGTALTLGSLLPLALAVLAGGFYAATWRRGTSPGRDAADGRDLEDVTRRLRDLARVGVLGAGFAVVLLVVAHVVAAATASSGFAVALVHDVSPLLVVAVAVTVTCVVLHRLAPLRTA